MGGRYILNKDLCNFVDKKEIADKKKMISLARRTYNMRKKAMSFASRTRSMPAIYRCRQLIFVTLFER
jgi:hypothetical protein